MIKNDPLMRFQFINETTRTVLAKGDRMLCPQLANFLSDLSDSENPVDYFYRGEGSTRILKAIKDEDAFLTAQDLDDFETEHQYGLQSHVEDTTLCGPHPPSLFAVVQLAVNAMQSQVLKAFPDLFCSKHINCFWPGSNSTLANIPLLSWDQSRLVADAIFDSDITKDVAKMTTGIAAKNLLQLLKDGHNPASKWESAEEGSFSVLVVDEKGDAASFGSSLGDKFGSRQFTDLGFFMNNAMGMFTYGTPPGSLESRNAPQAAKCPRTQMSPMIASKKGQTPLTVKAKNLIEDLYDFE
nr:Gamma-glutamyltranspeptidase domain containing protein [Haemonchus contortus]